MWGMDTVAAGNVACIFLALCFQITTPPPTRSQEHSQRSRNAAHRGLCANAVAPRFKLTPTTHPSSTERTSAPILFSQFLPRTLPWSFCAGFFSSSRSKGPGQSSVAVRTRRAEKEARRRVRGVDHRSGRVCLCVFFNPRNDTSE